MKARCGPEAGHDHRHRECCAEDIPNTLWIARKRLQLKLKAEPRSKVAVKWQSGSVAKLETGAREIHVKDEIHSF
ncbi:hypothetical protein EVAR_55974_1 [Eumeta japonica]|uniref:Uncharacterized protein n=1 Tax=Eumeta variegata TaxID=151549 RepID=A0A4C1YBE2_EUMVA|nr:hypothetical protein EVAR_55974_1 [Eumeta japonica]